MARFTGQRNLECIPTNWELVRRAHSNVVDAQSARHQLLQWYGESVKSYVLGATRDSDLANDI